MLFNESRDNDQNYRRSRAWARAKAAFGPGLESEVMTRLERLKGCPRLMMIAALHHFLSLPEDARGRVVHAYLNSLAQPAMELLPLDDSEMLNDEFEEAIRKIFIDEQFPGDTGFP